MRNAVIRTLDSLHFVIRNGSASIHLKAASEAEKQQWIASLEMAKNLRMDPRAYEESSVAEVNMSLMDVSMNEKQLHLKLEELESCFDLVKKQHSAIQKCMRPMEGITDITKAKKLLVVLDERAMIFRITATKLINNCRSFLIDVKSQRQTLNKAYTEERDLRCRLEDIVEKMARQQQLLEKNLVRSSKGTYQAAPGVFASATKATQEVRKEQPSSASTEDEEVFHDALDLDLLRMPVGSIVAPSADRLKMPLVVGAEDESDPEAYEYESSDDDEEESEVSEGQGERGSDGQLRKARARRGSDTSIVIRMPHAKLEDALPLSQKAEGAELMPKGVVKRVRRSSIPFKPDYSLNLWSIIKNCIGKDLSRIPVPVNFSEPLSMLQRLTEELEYSELLDRASQCADSCEQMAYVAAFTISVYSTTADRAAKPFNPLLGETYECDRTDDLGWRAIAEQVSHHPPALANYTEGRDWRLWQEFTMTSKFRGQYLSITPLGHCHLVFPGSGHHYTWKKVTTCVQNMIIGKLWIDNVGEMDIVNHKTGDRCHIKFYEYSMFSKDTPRKVAGIITDANKVAHWIINGKWNDFIEGAKVKNPEVITTRSRFETYNPAILWRRRYPPPALSRMYNFTTLAVQLNEPEEGVAPTDSRKRPDQRLMEMGRWDEANEEKLRLEEKQRSARRKAEDDNGKQRASQGETVSQCHDPAWFKRQHDDLMNTDVFVYTHEYWECKEKQDWSRCPNIF